MIGELRSAISAAFESDDYRARKRVIEEWAKERQGTSFEELRRKAQEKGIAAVRTPSGLVFAPMKNGEIFGPEESEKLSEEEHKRVEAEIGKLRQEVEVFTAQMPQIERDGHAKLRALDREISSYAVGNLIDEVRQRYASLPQVTNHL